MVKPPLRTKSIGFKVSEEEYAQLETAAQTSGQTLGEWCREAILRGGASNVAAHDPALAEIIGVRLLLVNVLGPDLMEGHCTQISIPFVSVPYARVSPTQWQLHGKKRGNGDPG